MIDRLTLEQANRHYRNGGGTPLTVIASKVDLSFVDPSIFGGRINGPPVTVNLSPNSRDGLVYGKLDLVYKGNGRVQIQSNQYDFITSDHPWFGGSFWRNTFTVFGNVLAGPGTPYMINFQGLGDLNYQPARFVPQFPTRPKY